MLQSAMRGFQCANVKYRDGAPNQPLTANRYPLPKTQTLAGEAR